MKNPIQVLIDNTKSKLLKEKYTKLKFDTIEYLLDSGCEVPVEMYGDNEKEIKILYWEKRTFNNLINLD